MNRFDPIFARLPRGHDLHWRLRALARTRGRGLLRYRRPRNKLVLFHIGRSGTNVLGSLLDQHRSVFWDSEIYEELFQSLEARRLPLAEAAGAIDPVAYLVKRMAWSGPLHYGFEVKFFHLSLFGVALADFVHRLEDLGFRHFVLLERKNTLRVVVSALIAARTGRWHQRVGERPRRVSIELETGKVSMDRDQKPLLAYLKDYQERFLELENLLTGKRVLWLNYEDDLSSNPLEGYKRVCRFLGETPEPAVVRWERTNPFPLEEVVTNLEEVRKSLEGSSFEWMGNDMD